MYRSRVFQRKQQVAVLVQNDRAANSIDTASGVAGSIQDSPVSTSMTVARSAADLSNAVARLKAGERLAIGSAPEECALLETGNTTICKLEIPRSTPISDKERCDLIIEKRADGSMTATSLTEVWMSSRERGSNEEVAIRTPIKPGDRIDIKSGGSFLVPDENGDTSQFEKPQNRAEDRLNRLSLGRRTSSSPMETMIERMNREDPVLIVPGGDSTLMSLLATNEALELKLSKYNTAELNRMLGIRIEVEPGVELRTSHLMAAVQPLANLNEPFRTILQRDLTLKFISDFEDTFAGGLKAAGMCSVRVITLPVVQGPTSERTLLHEAMHKLTIGDKASLPVEAFRELEELHSRAVSGLMADAGLNPEAFRIFNRLDNLLDKKGSATLADAALREIGLDPQEIGEDGRKELSQIAYYSNIDECFAEMGFYILDGRGDTRLEDFAEKVSGDRGKILGSGHFDAFYERYNEIVNSPEFKVRGLTRLALNEASDRLKKITPWEMRDTDGTVVNRYDAVGHEIRRRAAEELRAAAREGREPADVKSEEFKSAVETALAKERQHLIEQVAFLSEWLEKALPELKKPSE